MATGRTTLRGGLLAALIAAPAAAQCVGQVKIDRAGPLGPGIAVGGPVSEIALADTLPGGRPVHFRLSHSAPPDRVCVGQRIAGGRILAETLRFEREARGQHRAATVSVGFDAAFNLRMTCTARPPREAKGAAYEARGDCLLRGRDDRAAARGGGGDGPVLLRHTGLARQGRRLLRQRRLRGGAQRRPRGIVSSQRREKTRSGPSKARTSRTRRNASASAVISPVLSMRTDQPARAKR